MVVAYRQVGDIYVRCLTDARWRSVLGKRKRPLELWKFLNAERKYQRRGNAALSRSKRIIKCWACLASARRGFARGVKTDCLRGRARKSQAVGRFVEQASLVYVMAARITHREPDSVIRAILAVRHILMRLVTMTRHIRVRVALGSGVAI